MCGGGLWQEILGTETAVILDQDDRGTLPMTGSIGGITWGKHDLSFDLGEPERYRKDVPSAEVHVLDAGHFALDTKANEIAALVQEFMIKQ